MKKDCVRCFGDPKVDGYAEIPPTTHEDVMSFAVRCSKLYKSKQKMLAEEVDQINNDLDSMAIGARHYPHDVWKQWHDNHMAVKGSWHWIWCIVTRATLTMPNKIIPEVWKQALALLEKYEQGKIVDRKLVQPNKLEQDWDDAATARSQEEPGR